MLQIKNIKKQYITGDLVQTALDGVSLNLRDNEFVAVLGPSGSGKTTLLNMIGGLDRYDSGDLIINAISTSKYKDRDWDSYRNHTIGFVFQSYNLIPHQSILANVELALTISGISGKERRLRAAKALEEVGLGNQLHKKPNQMSGGQMQRVAIARALVNDPDILLADEPTGALDTETSVQVMELLKKVAEKRLVIMVTHNAELAEDYATRIVRLRDGRIVDDSDPYMIEDAEESEKLFHKNMGRSSMSFLTSLSLSFNNLLTKKGRTILTAFAGSIGIIGIALILSLSSGVNSYIEDLQKNTMDSYPITIEAQSLDISSLMNSRRENNDRISEEADHALDGVYSDGSGIELASSASMSVADNNLTEFKKYLDDSSSEIWQYIGQNGVVYSYDTKFSVYSIDPEGMIVNTDGSTLEYSNSSILTGSTGMISFSMTSTDLSSSDQLTGSGVANHNFEQMMSGAEGELISSTVTDNYAPLYGSWPEEFDEVVLVLDENNEIPASVLYQLGLLPSSEYEELIEKIKNDEEVTLDTQKWSYDEICSQTFYMIPVSDLYIEKKNGLFEKMEGTEKEIESLMEDAVQLKIVGVIRPDSDTASISGTIGYTSALTDYVINHTNNSPVVLAQQDSKTINILTGTEFSPEDDAGKVKAAKEYLSNLTVEEKAAIFREIVQYVYGADPSGAESILDMTDTQLAAALDDYVLSSEDAEDEQLLNIYDGYIGSGTYDDNLEAFGYISLDAPSGIEIYADSFEAKESITACIDNYNNAAEEENRITHTDYVGLLMSSVTSIVNVISYVLIAFVAVSLLVSSIMIGIITYISVLERTKEIGILRAIGASKRNISQVFNAETFIIGFCSGLLGVGIAMLILIPVNAVIHAVVGTSEVNAALPASGAVVLIVLSMFLTMLGGLIPAKKAARKDPVTALRAE
ncbi:MAG: ABC transporter ATP-binding protein/permease [Lachnospiraceae bacterium]|nr:ABC transporter ATP-binding protein/permease [Lachnospiraceae bacterium]